MLAGQAWRDRGWDGTPGRGSRLSNQSPGHNKMAFLEIWHQSYLETEVPKRVVSSKWMCQCMLTCDPTSARLSLVVHLIKVTQSDHPEYGDPLSRAASESRKGMCFTSTCCVSDWRFLTVICVVPTYPVEVSRITLQFEAQVRRNVA